MKRLLNILTNRQIWQLAASMAIVLAIGVGAWQLSSRWLANRFAQLAAEEQAEPAAIYQTLLALDDASVTALVKNATLRDPKVAAASRAALFTRVDAWNTAAQTDGRAKLAKRLEQLLKEIEGRVPQLTVTGQTWATKLTKHVLNQTIRLNESDRLQVIQVADRLLEEISISPAREDLVPAVISPTNVAEDTPPEPNPIVTSEVELKPVPIAKLEPTPLKASPDSDPNELPEAPEVLPEPQPNWTPDWQANAPTPPMVEVNEPSLTERIDSVTTQSDRQLLTYIHQKADEIIEATKQRESQSKPTAAGPGGPINSNDSSVPIDTYLIAIQEELVARGYTSLLKEEVRLFVSDEENDRLLLVSLLQGGNSGHHARMLLQLAQDDSPKVRIAALTTLGSSTQRELVEAAWKLSLRDTDPRVAALADQLASQLR